MTKKQELKFFYMLILNEVVMDAKGLIKAHKEIERGTLYLIINLYEFAIKK